VRLLMQMKQQQLAQLQMQLPCFSSLVPFLGFKVSQMREVERVTQGRKLSNLIRAIAGITRWGF
jgi:hypothetical protein